MEEHEGTGSDTKHCSGRGNIHHDAPSLFDLLLEAPRRPPRARRWRACRTSSTSTPSASASRVHTSQPPCERDGPEAEAFKQSLIMSSGYNEKQEGADDGTSKPARMESKSESSTASASKKSTAASSGSKPELVKKTIVKPRQLQRRHSCTDRPAMRGLPGDFDIEADKNQSDRKELWTDEEMRERGDPRLAGFASGIRRYGGSGLVWGQALA